MDKELCKFIKVCKSCGKLKLMIKMAKQKNAKDGRANKCYLCERESQKKYIKICEYCGEEFKGTKNQKCCNDECRSKLCGLKHRGENNPRYGKEGLRGEDNPKYNSIKFNCDYCGEEKKTKESQYNKYKNHFCSKECYYKWKKENSENMKGENSPRYNSIKFNCDYCGEEHTMPKSEYDKKEHHFCSKECYYKWRSENIRGENNPSWNPNLTDEEREDNRNTLEYKEFIKSVLKRDNYICALSGQRGAKLVVHHLNGYHWFKEGRTDVNNAVTLSEDIHKLFHKIYGNHDNTKEQFEEFKHRYQNGEFIE